MAATTTQASLVKASWDTFHASDCSIRNICNLLVRKELFPEWTERKTEKKKLEEIHTTWLLSAWLWFPRQPQVVQDGSRGICLAPLSAWSAWDNTAASFMQPILLCGWGYMIYIPPLPLILLTLSTNTRQLFSKFFLYNTSNCFSQCRLS